jgi:hypothetical protein
MTGTRDALIIATGKYEDPELRGLRAPAQDERALTRVLADPAIGGFHVESVVDKPARVITRAAQQFFANRGLDDLLLLHLSCHGVKDDDGRLYFAATDTEKKWLASTGVAASFMADLMERCRARSIVLLLDCCYSGAFVPGAKGDEGVHLKERFERAGEGRAVLTASNDIEYSWEGDARSGEGAPSLFTAAIVEGLETGEADRDRDGMVSIEDLNKHVYERVRAKKPGQTPKMWAWGIEHNLYLARNPRPIEVQAAALPSELQAEIESPLSGARAGIVEELGRLLRSTNAGLALAAQQALELLSDDDSKRVSAAAIAALAAQATSQQSAEAKAREERERKAKAAQERTAEQEARAEKARQAGAEKARQAEAEKAREEQERKAREERERKAREEQERKPREEQERKARQEQEAKARPTIPSGGDSTQERVLIAKGALGGDDSGPKSFWTTTRKFLAALTGFVGAVATLIVTLNAVGVIGRDDGTPSPTTSVSPAVDDAVLKGVYAVTVQVTALSGAEYLGENYVWAFQNPHLNESDTETWTLNSVCGQEACETSWGPASDKLSSKFTTLERDGGTYRKTITGQVHCIPAANVERSIELNVTNAARVDRVWTVTRFTGTIRIDWVCNGHAVSAVLDLDARRSQT